MLLTPYSRLTDPASRFQELQASQLNVSKSLSFSPVWSFTDTETSTKISADFIRLLVRPKLFSLSKKEEMYKEVLSYISQL